eukprot:m.145334 g.145334  ORF g.145334 m.145334 type:complete len:54 (+) comp38419_c0_seq5:109-270(+)
MTTWNINSPYLYPVYAMHRLLGMKLDVLKFTAMICSLLPVSVTINLSPRPTRR